MLCHGGSVQKNLAVQVGRLKYAAHPTHEPPSNPSATIQPISHHPTHQPPSNPSVKHLSQVSELRDLPHFHYVQRLQNLAVQLFNSPPLNIPPAKLGFHHWFPPPAIKPSYVAIIHAAPRQGPPAPRSQGVISASVVVAPGQIFYAKFIQKPCI